MMLSLQKYSEDPCGMTSLPYWKQKGLVVPENMRIVHKRDYSAAAFDDYVDDPYFRLYHSLQNVKQTSAENVEILFGEPDVREFVRLINASYADLQVTVEQMERYRTTPVYASDLWLLLKEKATGVIVGGGIADYDEETGELILEWIQVLPAYRGRGFGQVIVNSLLTKMQGKAKFATVSGKVNNPTKPEMLYRKCGFVGNDIWHILTKKL